MLNNTNVLLLADAESTLWRRLNFSLLPYTKKPFAAVLKNTYYLRKNYNKPWLRIASCNFVVHRACSKWRMRACARISSCSASARLIFAKISSYRYNLVRIIKDILIIYDRYYLDHFIRILVSLSERNNTSWIFDSLSTACYTK